MRIVWIGLASATLVSTGCYPVHKTLQKKARVQVVDERGGAISGAEVHLITSSYPYGAERDRETKTTGDDGVATFGKESEWRVESLMIHGNRQESSYLTTCPIRIFLALAKTNSALAQESGETTTPGSLMVRNFSCQARSS